MSKQFWGVLAIIAIIFVGIFVVSGNKNNGSSTSASSTKPSEHIEGLGKDNVTLVEYGDYECPYCEEYFTTVTQIQEQYNNQIYYQFRNFPLTSIHPNAFAGARAAEAAGIMGKYWQMHDLLYAYSNWDVWSTSSDPSTYFYQYAQELGLNVTKFKTEFASSQVNNLINADITAGNKLNIQGTPTFYLDGKQIQPAPTVASFEGFINSAIAQKTKGAKGAASAPTTSTTSETSTGTAKTD
jgi:protein-disulfide isomerase